MQFRNQIVVKDPIHQKLISAKTFEYGRYCDVFCVRFINVVPLTDFIAKGNQNAQIDSQINEAVRDLQVYDPIVIFYLYGPSDYYFMGTNGLKYPENKIHTFEVNSISIVL